MQLIDLATQTTFAELVQRTLDADFDEQFPEKGSFRRKNRKIVTTGSFSGVMARP